MVQDLEIRSQHFIMHPSGVLFWKEKSMLLISDVHLGKISHFRKFGAAVPQAAVLKNFEAMDRAINFFQPEIIVFMGDLFHSSLNKEWQLFEKWVSTVISEIILVAGNHDIISPLKYEDLGIRVISEIQLDGFLLTHHPEEREGFFNFSGHIHPAVRLQGLGRQSVRLSCFFKSDNQMILPAFGTFTGTYVLEPEPNNEIFALTEDEVFQVQFKESRRKKRY
ncbi:ligase-associated DNA damage response endonuclease PdeM [Zobellia barbeyronii]|uniref:Ligase-associated DNA damage response endonuclease PdeM n=1 Tax=Zobellia barbeyronii TaxID=2748009 RepID=A0ABS5WAA3_9FLAO|nr:ligase-associated DNA damage response endonuclease PdeM [Zobellia barbeyronii]MBT2159980.1 ligase-associated DNA damage response endonuclease PdeM [Zobellia barbeyronii]